MSTNTRVLSELSSYLLVQLGEGNRTLLVVAVAVVHNTGNSTRKDSAKTLTLSVTEVDGPTHPLASLRDDHTIILPMRSTPQRRTSGL